MSALVLFNAGIYLITKYSAYRENALTDNVTSFEFWTITSTQPNPFLPRPHPSYLPPTTWYYYMYCTTYPQGLHLHWTADEFLGAHESLKSKLGDSILSRTLLFSSLTIFVR